MAGIGFVLERLLLKGGARNLFIVAVSGTALVAGPWLLSAASIFLAVSLVPSSVAAPFQQTLVYVFAGSLLFFGGMHLTYTRRVADLHFFNMVGPQRLVLVKAIALVTLLSLVLGALLALFTVPGAATREAWQLRGLVVLMVVAVNVSFLEMIHATQIERFFLVPAGYLSGGAVIVLLAKPFTEAQGLGGMYAAFVLGFLVVDIFLFGVSLSPKHKGSKRRSEEEQPDESDEAVPESPPPGVSLSSPKENRALWLAGTALYLLLWLDKLYYWFILGYPVAGTGLYGYPDYDVAIFWGQITIIPGLIYYLVAGETDFFRELRRTVRAIMNRPFIGVQRQKLQLVDVHHYHLARQTVLQLSFVAALVPLTPHLARLIYGSTDGVIVILMVLVGSALYLTHYTLFINLLYLKRYKEATLATTVGILVTALSLLIPPEPERLLGLPFALGSAAGIIAGAILFRRAARLIDRQILTQR